MYLTKRLFSIMAVLPLAMPVFGLGAAGTDNNGVQTETNRNADKPGTLKTEGTTPPKKLRHVRHHHMKNTSNPNGTEPPVITNNSPLSTPGTMGNHGTSNTGTTGTSTSGQ
jgi:hypothetical protein